MDHPPNGLGEANRASERSGANGAVLPRSQTARRLSRLLKSVWKIALRKPLGVFGLFITIALVVTAAGADWIATHDPVATDQTAPLLAPSTDHLFGTDQFGRDLFSRIVHGARISLSIGFISALLGTTFGAFLGLVSGYVGGKFDLFLQRIMDIFMTFTLLVLAIAIAAAHRQSQANVLLAIALPIIPRVQRTIRSQSLVLREAVFVEAARALGASVPRIVLRHMAPNTTAVYLVLVSSQLGAAILVEASLSFLGLGVPQPHPSWGGMLSGASGRYAEIAPWLVIFPGIAISLVVFGFNLFGDALRDVLDPRLRKG